MAQPLNPPILWAQRKDQIFLSVDLQDIKDQQIVVDTQKLTFTGSSGNKKYHAELDFLKEIDKEKSKYLVRPRNIEFVLIKKEPGPYWERLLKEPGKRNWLKADWEKWVDEDEVEKAEGFDMGGMEGFDMANMPDFSGMGGEGAGGDSDDDEIPGLEEDEAEKKKEMEEETEEKK